MIIFLDIDGVIATRVSYARHKDHLYRPSIRVLNDLIRELNAEVVLSSTWRYRPITELKDMLTGAGLEANILGITPIGHSDRGSQILSWIESNNYDGEYVVIDDDIFDIKGYIDNKHILYVQNGFAKKGLTQKHIQYWKKINKGRLR